MLPKCGFILCVVLLFICSEVHSGLSVIDATKAKADANPDPDWFKNAVIYRIFARSFKEHDGGTTGIGTLEGIKRKLENLEKTGITAIWLSQIYDPKDFKEVHPNLLSQTGGTTGEFESLVKAAHDKDIKVLLDFDINHSSKDNNWFIQSVAGTNPADKDYYVWKDKLPASGSVPLPPNNWKSIYNDSAWEWVGPPKNQFYLHQFAIDQPDLNYANTDLQNEIKDILKGWLDLGVDGIILDTVPYLFESNGDEPPNPNVKTDEYKYESLLHTKTKDQQATFDFIYGLRKLIDENDPTNHKILITAADTDLEKVMKYFEGPDTGGFTGYGGHITLNFLLLPHHKGTTTLKLVESINDWLKQKQDKQTANWLIGDHNHHRAATRFGPENVDNMNILIASLPGIMITYNGEEIGQENGEVTYLQCQDPIGCKAGPADFSELSRDFERTPYHWDGELLNGGFTSANPWLPVSKKYTETNLENQKSDLKSHYGIYKSMVTLRRNKLKDKNVTVEHLPDDVIKVTRGGPSETDTVYIVLINMGGKPAKVKAAGNEKQLYFVEYSTDASITEKEYMIFETDLTLAGNTAIILRVIPIKKATYDWWRNAVIYQIYVRSFKDSDDNGVGDLGGIINELGYLQELGINVICLSSILDSPHKDLGYDVKDFKKIDNRYQLEDGQFKKLIEEAKKLGIKIIMDFVPNHSSDQHSEFSTSSQSREKYYVISKETEESKIIKNNWLSIYHGKAWSEAPGNIAGNPKKYYLHQYGSTQPDFNYEKKDVKDYIEGALKHWLDLGVTGFRMTGVPYLFEDDYLSCLDLPSNDPEAEKDEWKSLRHVCTSNRPATFDIIYEWRKLLDIYTAMEGGDERILITEANTDIQNTIYYYGTKNKKGAHFSLNFLLTEKINETSNAHAIAAKINEWADLIPEGFTSNWMLGNHDKHRVATRFGPENVDGFNMLIAILPGVMVTYNGEEIGMEDGEVPLLNCAGDPIFCDNDLPEAEKKKLLKFRRDQQRTPFHWDSSVYAGFTTDKARDTWLPVSNKKDKTNLALQMNESKSHYKLYKRLLKLRQETAFVSGSLKVKAVTDYVLTSLRYHTVNESYFHVFNLGSNEEIFDLKTAYNESTPFLEVIETNNPELLANGTLLDARNITLQGHQSIIVAFTIKTIPSSSTIHVISTFVLLVGLLINRINFI